MHRMRRIYRMHRIYRMFRIYRICRTYYTYSMYRVSPRACPSMARSPRYGLGFASAIKLGGAFRAPPGSISETKSQTLTWLAAGT